MRASAPDRGLMVDVMENEQTDPQQERERRPRVPVLQLGALALLAALLVVDLVEDSAATSTRHVAIEVGATVLAVAAATSAVLRWIAARRRLERRVDELGTSLRLAGAEVELWRNEAHDALQGLGAAIEKQCDRWALTDAERAVAMLLLKGLSMKEIADARGTAERTTRQQALAVYRKAGLAGRAELAAFFLEDLLLPSSTTSGGG